MEEIENLACMLCQSKQKNILKYGKFYVKDGVCVHYFCLLLTSNLPQNGKDDEGILGFLPKDIKEKSERVQLKKCVYCQNNGANISCCLAKCKRTFHFICGIENGAHNQFVGAFRSFCDRHIFKILKKCPPSGDNCSICYENFSSQDLFTMALCAPCCKNGWFHKWCLQEFANNAGYFFKCPLCNDKKKFCEQLPILGVFIPEKDAEWELEPHAFEDFLERPKTCSANSCLCELGRNFTDKNKYRFYFCYLCGSKGIHKLCKTDYVKEKNEIYKCLDCVEILNTSVKTRDSGFAEIEIEKNSNEDEVVNVEDIDIDESEEDILDQITNRGCSTLKESDKTFPKASLTKFNNSKYNSGNSGVSEVGSSNCLKSVDRPRFVTRIVSPTILKNVKRAYENFEHSLKRYHKSVCDFDNSATTTKNVVKETISTKNYEKYISVPNGNDLQVKNCETELECKYNLVDNNYLSNSVSESFKTSTGKVLTNKRRYSNSSDNSFYNFQNTKQGKLLKNSEAISSSINGINVGKIYEKSVVKKRNRNSFIHSFPSTSKFGQISSNIRGKFQTKKHTFSSTQKFNSELEPKNIVTLCEDDDSDDNNKIDIYGPRSKSLLQSEDLNQPKCDLNKTRSISVDFSNILSDSDRNKNCVTKSILKIRLTKKSCSNYENSILSNDNFRKLISANANSSFINLNKNSEMNKNNRKRKMNDMNSDSDSSTSNKRLFSNNCNVLRKNAKSKLSPINRKISSRSSFN